MSMNPTPVRQRCRPSHSRANHRSCFWTTAHSPCVTTYAYPCRKLTVQTAHSADMTVARSLGTRAVLRAPCLQNSFSSTVVRMWLDTAASASITPVRSSICVGICVSLNYKKNVSFLLAGSVSGRVVEAPITVFFGVHISESKHVVSSVFLRYGRYSIFDPGPAGAHPTHPPAPSLTREGEKEVRIA
jgi:hypothetical protein